MPDLAELTTHCIRCGFCLEACPTFTESASELDSPRGRIYLVRSALEGRLSWAEDVAPSLNRCLGCRACETACPSGVEYGQILELARDRMGVEWAERALLSVTTNPHALQLNLAMGKLWPGHRMPGFVSRLVARDAPQADLPTPAPALDLPPLEESRLPPVRGEVYVLEGCAMRVLYPGVHACTRRLLRRVGYRVRESNAGCCGAMHAHNGDLATAHHRADALAKAMPDDLPVVVNSAGCGSTMKEYQDRQFAARVFDAGEFLARSGLTEVLARDSELAQRVTYHDACHLAHGQGIRSAPRDLIQSIRGIEMVEMEEADTCCGSAGVYNVLQPRMARQLLERKYRNIAATGAEIVATGNPGCHAWIAQAAREHGDAVRVLHTMELLELALNPR